ncbi:hypothetical protein [Rhodospirillum sp. A1_3_36]|uniref:hypothetical protein n=1 Tax=Rhodospirillum sp. A1_3_36 TaxID=3391666 RepID=UPI0039A7334C
MTIKPTERRESVNTEPDLSDLPSIISQLDDVGTQIGGAEALFLLLARHDGSPWGSVSTEALNETTQDAFLFLAGAMRHLANDVGRNLERLSVISPRTERPNQ